MESGDISTDTNDSRHLQKTQHQSSFMFVGSVRCLDDKNLFYFG